MTLEQCLMSVKSAVSFSILALALAWQVSPLSHPPLLSKYGHFQFKKALEHRCQTHGPRAKFNPPKDPIWPMG